MQFKEFTSGHVRLYSAEDFACYVGKSREASDGKHVRLAGLTIPMLLTWTVVTRAAS